MELPAADLQQIRDLYYRGLYRQALTAAEPFGPLRTWSGAAARLLAGRLAIQVGAPQMGHQLHIAAYREFPANLEAIYYHTRYRLEKFGPLSAIRFMRQHEDWSDAPPGLRADWLAVQALIYARIGDLDRAEKALAQAEAGAVDRAWIFVERATVLEVLDRHTEAMDSARRALEIQPWFRPAVQAVAHLLHHSGQVGEAIEFLKQADQHLEASVVSAMLVSFYLEENQYAEVTKYLDRYELLSPLMEKDVRKWLDARRSDVAYVNNDRAAVIHHAKAIGDDFYLRFAEQLAAVPADVQPYVDRRKILDLDLNYTGDAPSAQEWLCRYWKQPKLEETEYQLPTDGLPDAIERRRFDEADWLTREFTISEETAWELTSRGVPYLLTLVETGYGQERIVFGADQTRGTLFFAEGSERRPVEAPISMLKERYPATGPRALVALPKAEAAKLDGITFPDGAEYDALNRIQLSLADRRYTEARKLLAEMGEAFPGHRLTHYAELAWSRATQHPVWQLEACEALLSKFPKDSTLILSRASAFRDLGRMTDRRDVLSIAYEEGVNDPLLMQSLAQMYLPHPGKQVEAEQILRRSIRLRPNGAPGYYLLASQLWEQQKFDESLELYRIACCLDDRESQFAESYNRAARSLNQGSEAMRLFQHRSTRQPLPYVPAVESLYNALVDRGDLDFAWAAVQKAIEKARAAVQEADQPKAREALGDALLFAAEVAVMHSRPDESDKYLAEAKTYTEPGSYLRTAAKVARWKPDLRAALGFTRELVALEPTNLEHHRMLFTLLSEVEGRPAARQYLVTVVSQWPEHYGLAKFLADSTYADKDEVTLTSAQHLLTLCPRDAWAHRQLGQVYADQKRHAEARAAMDEAAKYEPTHSSHFTVLAYIHRRADRIEAALDTYRQSLRHHPDNELAIFEMMQLARGLKEKKAALRALAEELHQQPHTGDGLLAYHAHAQELIDDPDEREKFVAQLERILDERPDLWQAWSVVVQSLANNERLEEATALANEAAERFPLSARTWLDLAMIHKFQDQTEEQIECLRKAVAIAPSWVLPCRELAAALTESERAEEAHKILQVMIIRGITDPMAHWVYAEHLWENDRGEEALYHAKQTVRFDASGDPRLDSAWRAVMMWGDRLDKPDDALEFARELTEERAGDPRAWLRYARTITEIAQTPEILRALDRALKLDPKNVEAYDLKAERLAMLGRFEEALEAAKPSVLAADMPLILQGRVAWIEARRGNYAAAIPPMQALVAVDPDYIWGWQQLAEWYNDVGKPESYLEATSELIRMRPESPTSLTMRGDAKIQTGDREGGKEDLREALRVHPGYSPAAVILFDACLQDGEQKEARAALSVLQEHMSGPEVLVKQIQFLTRTGDHDAAARTFSELAMTPGEGPPVYMQMAMTEMARADLGEKAAELLRNAWESGEEFHPWATIFWLETPDGEAADEEEKLEACDAVVKHYPEFISGHDRRAELLAQLDRYDEAAEACRPPAFGDSLPLPLKGRAAWVESARGNLEKGIEMMKAVLRESSDYPWGWRQLTLWFKVIDQPRDRLEAADQLVRLTPNEAMSHYIRGEAKQALGDNRGAKDDFEKSFDLDPEFEPAGLELIESQLEIADLYGAAKTLEVLKENSSSPNLKFRSLQVAARQGKLDVSRKHLQELLQDMRINVDTIQESLDEFRNAGWMAEAEAELRQAVQSPSVTNAAATSWVGILVAQGHSDEVANNLDALIERNRDAGREAVLSYALALNITGERKDAAMTVQRFAELLRQDDESWARAGSVLLDAKEHRLCIAWLSDWETRDGPEAWMMRFLFDAYQHVGQDAEAEELARKVVELDDVDDEVLPDYLSWLALYAALAGKTDTADDYLERIEPVGQPDGIRVIYTFAQTLVSVQRAADKSQEFAEAKKELQTASESCVPEDRLVGTTRIYTKVVSRLAQDVGTLSAKFWMLAQRVRPLFKDAKG
ncbi:MAG: tetratricopeptide repeat protein [Fimbriiglobus sp.]